MKKLGLGRGLSSLITPENTTNNAYIPNLDISKVYPNPYQPRMKIDDEKLAELAASIKETGVIEPLLVTKINDSKYELIAGERRWRASKLAGLETVPVVVKEASHQQMLELAVVENVQRADLNPLEEAVAYQQLVDEFHLSIADIAQKVGCSTSVVSNRIRLLNLPESIKKGLLEDILSEGHAKALLGIKNVETMLLAYNKVVNQNLSVRATEELVRRLNLGVKKTTSHGHILDSKTVNYESNLRNYFNNDKIRLSRTSKGGKIEIRFKSDKELDDLMFKIGIN